MQTRFWPVGCVFRINRVHLCRELRHHNECPGYDIRPSDGEVPVKLEL